MKTYLTLISFFICFFGNAQNDGWHISTQNSDEYTGIVMSNGRLGILPSEKPLEVKQVILNNVYDKVSPDGVSKVLEGMNFGNLSIAVDGELITAENIDDWKQTIDLKEAKFTTLFSFKNKVAITYTIYALRNVPYTGYIDVRIDAKKGVDVKVTGKIETPKVYQNPTGTFRVFQDLESSIPILQSIAKSREGKHTVTTSATFVWHGLNSANIEERPVLEHEIISEYKHQLSFENEIEEGTYLNFAWTAAQCTSNDFADPQAESERFVTFNLLTPRTELTQRHKKQWASLWEGDIIIEGDLESQQDVRLALYHLYAFGRADSDLSISPMGLSSQGYNGHVFWDAEIWMFPPILALNAGIAHSMMNYRFNRLAAAERKAANFGYEGAMFPWESDDTGEEATPTWALTGTFEHHITADIGIAFWNYYRVTRDKQWLADKGFPMLKAVSEYWLSRVTENEDGTYSIKNVIGANEYAHNVDDNAFTNGATITVLCFTALAAEILGEKEDPKWLSVANGIMLHKFENGVIKEHSNYVKDTIKQTDVNLLAYPLSIVEEEDEIRKDLAFYQSKLDPDGPAMGKSVLAVIYARLGEVDTAYALFKESYIPNKRAPFGALSESATSNNPYFATGAGGMLQTVLFGFGGLHITNNGIIQKKGVLPKEWKSLTITGVGPNKLTYKVGE